MASDVAHYVASCPCCQLVKPSNQKPWGELLPLDVPSGPWESVGMDFIVQLPKTPRGHTAILTVVDRLTKAAHFIPCNDSITARQTARLFFDNVFRLHGMPRSIVSDRDPRFTSQFWQVFTELVGMQCRMSTAFHPQTDGLTERTHRTLEDMLRSFAGDRQEEWDELLTAAEFAYNNSVQQSTGFTPFFLQYGRHPVDPAALDAGAIVPKSASPAADAFVVELQRAFVQARANLGKAQERQKRTADLRRLAASLKVGDLVKLSVDHLHLEGRRSRKLTERYIGPFKVLDIVGERSSAVRLDLPPEMKIHPVVNVSRLRPWREDPRFIGRPVRNPPPIAEVDGTAAYEVEAFMAHRMRRGQQELLVRWMGYGPEFDQWIAVKQLRYDMGPCFDELLETLPAAALESYKSPRARAKGKAKAKPLVVR